MALAKIELKLGKKVISLTPSQFEELKADMRELDKSHHYYWHGSPWYQSYYTGIRSPLTVYGSSSGSLSCDTAGRASITNAVSTLEDAKPPEYNGTILSTA